ncbi:glycine--tRNA ligase subunit beta [Kroppenstedtia pulmonis]|uniref:Glycine--tRNA ligase beta subunit n=1 Tax=Kroppenstedtia pulmonis TaxID=1380685 RepID=A0A7D4BGC1_9BACL|nr:glycine--tRNA ligase subunit beta [Kroppenstedtia pulmonis]QKG84932.1 glycine--tRNA ligase subunit beta [Kroppenstedtia pulmonis]
MPKRDLLFEIGCEEIPARYVEQGTQQLSVKLSGWLKDHRITYTEIETFGTPRRLAAVIRQVAEFQEDIEEEVKGPARRIALAEDGSWSKAAEGFARKQGVSVEDLSWKEFKGETYVFAKKHQKGLSTADLLKEKLPTMIESLHFPQTMRWGSRRNRFIRPVRWLVCLFGEEVIPVEWAGVTASNRSRGHRFLGEEVTILSPAHYADALEGEWVIPDVSKRRSMIREQLTQLEKEHGWRIPVDEGLLDEVTHLVEYPTALYGSFDEEYLELPPAVLITTMREHQRYFPVEGANGELLPYFVTVRNGDDHALDVVAKGNEKVLSARLADARFFYDEDLKTPIQDAIDKLDQVVYFEGLGTVGDQVRRIRSLVLNMAYRFGLEAGEVQKLLRAAEISKFDLTTYMVSEFPELAGIMGEEYAVKAGENPAVAQAVLEHHYPRFGGDTVPEFLIGSLISLADKVDAVASAFSIGIQPTGSQDPYGLRRRAAGAVQILMEKRWPEISLDELLTQALTRLQHDGWLKRPLDEVKGELLSFFQLRLKASLQDQGIRYDIIDAVLASDLSYPWLVVEKAKTLSKQVEEESFKHVVEGFSRAANLAEKGESGVEVDPEKFAEEAEHNLWEAVVAAKETFNKSHKEQHAEAMYNAIQVLAPVIHNFFDEVLVMVEDEDQRKNRLALLGEIHQLVTRYAAFKKIVFA